MTNFNATKTFYVPARTGKGFEVKKGEHLDDKLLFCSLVALRLHEHVEFLTEVLDIAFGEV